MSEEDISEGEQPTISIDLIIDEVTKGNFNAFNYLDKVLKQNRKLCDETKEVIEKLHAHSVAKNGYASYYLGHLYSDGIGVPKSPQKGFEYQYNGALQGNADCQYIMGAACVRQKKYDDAIVWLEKAVDGNNPEVAEMLGDIYLKIKKNYVKAQTMYRREMEIIDAAKEAALKRKQKMKEAGEAEAEAPEYSGGPLSSKDLKA